MLPVRKYLTSGLIGLLTLVAITAIYVLITGELGWAELKALLSVLILFAAGLNAVTCISCRPALPRPGLAWVGVGLGTVSAILLLLLLWSNGWLNLNWQRWWQPTSVLLVWTLVYTHCLWPVLVRLDGTAQRWLIPLTRASSLLLGALLSYGIIANNADSLLLRGIAVISILVGFFSLVLVILHRRQQPGRQRLALTATDEADIYQDGNGQYYRVTALTDTADGQH